MRKALLIGVIATLLLLFSCARNKVTDPKALLKAELIRWENFSAEGVAEANYMGLSLRKMFVLSKTMYEARLDILDGGALGINPSPLVSAYIGDYLAMQAPVFPQLEKLVQSRLKPGLSLRILANADSLTDLYGDTIIQDRKLTLANTELEFDPNYRVVKIYDIKSKAAVELKYTTKGEPDEVTVTLGKNSLRLLVDEISYGSAEVVPLPRPEPGDPVNQFLEFMDQILKLEEGGKP